jgi:hypothetical protein
MPEFRPEFGHLNTAIAAAVAISAVQQSYNIMIRSMWSSPSGFLSLIDMLLHITVLKETDIHETKLALV